jgi:hypothetical protein
MRSRRTASCGEPLYQLEKEGAFKRGDARGIAFANARLAAGATELRNMIMNAWQDSAPPKAA